MENNYFIVQWIHESPLRCSVMASTDIVDQKFRNSDSKSLINLEIEFRWKKTQLCTGRILASGSKAELVSKIKDYAPKKTLSSGLPTREKVLPIPSTSALAKKARIDVLVSSVEGTDKDDIILKLKQDLAIESKRAGDLLTEIGVLKVQIEQLENQIKNSADMVDIGNGITLNREYLSTIKSTSTTMNVFARNLFKKLFESHEVIGFSLMGKSCNANHRDKQPSVDPRRRDAIIEHSLKTFGKMPGSESYGLAMKDLKKSLSCLIAEITKDAKSMEEHLNA